MDGLRSHEEWFGIHITHKNGFKKKKFQMKTFQFVFNIFTTKFKG
jgi:hypothetical protein